MGYPLELDPELDEFETTDELEGAEEFEQDETDLEFARRAAFARRGGFAPQRAMRTPYPLRRPRPAVAGGLAPYAGSACVCPQHGTEFVRWVQTSLNQLQGERLRVSGVVDRATRQALRRFQSARQLAADGIAGPDTEQAILAARRGQGGTDVAQGAQAAEFELALAEPELDELDELDELAGGDEFESDEDRFRWPRGRTFSPQDTGTIPSGPYTVGSGSGLCSALDADLQELVLSIGPFSRSVAELRKLTRAKPRDQAAIDSRGERARNQMIDLKAALEKMRDRVKAGHYLRQGCTRANLAKVTAKVRAFDGPWRSIATIERLRDQLVYWLRKSR